MVKVKTFMSPLKIFHTVNELAELDEEVNKFARENGVKAILSISDTCTTDASGATIGIIRAIVYDS